MFDKIPHSALHKARKANLQAFYAFNKASPEDGVADFADDSTAVGKERMSAYLKL